MMAALITGLRVKKETIGEITAAAQVMREVATKVVVADTTHLVDIVGTGGDGSHTFNISTCSMFVAAAAGAKVQDVDGVRVLTDDGWWLLRASNTQAVLVARVEASSEAGLERLKADLAHQITASGLAVPDFSGANAGH
jgi:phosphomannomutase